VLEGEVVKIFDVSHNPASIAYLATRLDEMECSGKTVAVFSMLADKDIGESIKSIQNKIDMWFVAPLSCKRAASADRLKLEFQSAHIQQINFCNSMEDAYSMAQTIVRTGDRIVVFGSFHTVSEVYRDTLTR
jgi:dihydrofolate synthase/folylpolyglutamate synthase